MLVRSIVSIFVAACACAAMANRPQSQPPAVPWFIDARAVGSQVVVNEVPVFAFRASRGESTPDRRAQQAAATVALLKGADTIEVLPPDGPIKDWRVGSTGRTIATITPQDARANGSTPQGLASRWANELMRAARLDPIVVGSASVLMPPDKPSRITIVGRLARRASITFDSTTLVKVTRAPGSALLTPRRTGKATMTVSFASTSIQVPVEVRPYAMRSGGAVTATVLGAPAQPWAVSTAIRSALARIPLPPEGRLQVGTVPERTLASGQSFSADIPVSASAPGHFPTETTISVSVVNAGLMPRNETKLWYSNVPENVRTAQRLYWGRLQPGETTRLLSHHKNIAGYDLDILYSLVNPGDTPVQVCVSMGDSRPDPNPTLAGYVAGDEFLREWMTRSGEVISIPPRSMTPLIFRRTKPEQTMSALGVLHLMPNSSSPIVLVAESLRPGAGPAAWRSWNFGPSPWSRLPSVSYAEEGVDLRGEPKHIYAPPMRSEKFTYAVGGRFTFVRIGEQAIERRTEDSYENLLGNFGVHYFVEGVVSNPTGAPQNVEIVFEASAGYSGAVFLVNGDYLPARLLQGKDEVKLWSQTLAPGESARVVIQTIPLSGAHYPATIIVRPAGSR